MTYQRFINRNRLTSREDIDLPNSPVVLRSDLRRLETDQRDERHLQAYALEAGITEAQAKIVLDVFFEDG